MSRIALVHPLSLVGKELAERLESRPDLASSIRLYSENEDEIGTVTEAGGAAAFVNRLSEGDLDDVDLTFFCGDAAVDRPLFRHVPGNRRAIVLSRDAASSDGAIAVARLNEGAWAGESRLVVPAPGATLVATLAAAVAPLGVRSVVATMVHPVSELGQRGLDALFDETRALLTFSPTPKAKLFPAQVAFNLIPGTPDGPEIDRQIRALLGASGPRIATQSVQGGIFHAVSASLLLEFEREVSTADLRRTLGKSAHLSVVKNSERLGPVEAAGEDRILVGDVREASGGGLWLWTAMDNLTTGGANAAIRLAEAVLGSGPTV